MSGRFTGLKEKEKRPAFVELMTKPIGKTRRKAIATVMRRNNISFEEARKRQAKRIVYG